MSDESLDSFGIYNKLIDELSSNRKEYDDMLNSILEFRKNINNVLPKPVTGDYRNKEKYNRFAMEETMKTISNVINLELGIRKAKEAGIKTEIDIRRKISGEDDGDQKIIIEQITKYLENHVYGKQYPNFDEENVAPDLLTEDKKQEGKNE